MAAGFLIFVVWHFALTALEDKEIDAYTRLNFLAVLRIVGTFS